MIPAVLWGATALLALFWTGGAFLTAELAQWAAGALGSGAALETGRALAALPVPAWMSAWLDPAWVRAVQSMLAWALEAGQGALPLIGSAAGWLVPAVWVLWGMGLLVLLLAAGGVHFALRRWRVGAARA